MGRGMGMATCYEVGGLAPSQCPEWLRELVPALQPWLAQLTLSVELQVPSGVWKCCFS